jgi:hypothetical protein
MEKYGGYGFHWVTDGCNKEAAIFELFHGHYPWQGKRNVNAERMAMGCFILAPDTHTFLNPT